MHRAGRWNNNSMDKSYMSIPYEALRGLAGFEGKRSFFLPRATVEPPIELQKLIFKVI